MIKVIKISLSGRIVIYKNSINWEQSKTTILVP